MYAPSGRQFEIAHGALRGVVTEVGATLRTLTIGEEPVLEGFAANERASDGRGQVLAPWPNRLEDGSYTFASAAGRAPLDEPDRMNAIHGLVRWLTWRVEEHRGDTVRLAVDLAAQPAYPFSLRLVLTYSLGDNGLLVEVGAENLGEVRAPFGIGFHPYIACGPGGVDAATLATSATHRLVFDERALPVGEAALATTAYARLTADAVAPIGDLVLDDCLFDLAVEDGHWAAELRRGDGRRARLWGEAAFRYLMCFTGDTLAPERRRRAIALEPMTCPPNALRTGTDLLVLDPGARVGARWGIEPLS